MLIATESRRSPEYVYQPGIQRLGVGCDACGSDCHNELVGLQLPSGCCPAELIEELVCVALVNPCDGGADIAGNNLQQADRGASQVDASSRRNLMPTVMTTGCSLQARDIEQSQSILWSRLYYIGAYKAACLPVDFACQTKLQKAEVLLSLFPSHSFPCIVSLA